MNIYKYLIVCSAAWLFTPGTLFAADKEAKMALSFSKHDSVNVCNVTVTSEDKPAKDVSVKLYVKRLFGLLPVGKAASTDENGIASFDFPKDIPGDADGKLTIFAKIEDDDTYGSLQTKGEINWGVAKAKDEEMGREIYGARNKAPIYFIVAANLIIAGIWGTLIYVLFQVYKIKRISKHLIKDK